MLIRLRSFSPSSSATRQGRSASEFCRSTSGPDADAIKIGLQLLDRRVHLLAERHPVQLIERGLMEALTDAVGLRALGLGAGVIDVLDREIKLVLVPLRVAAELAATVGPARAAA